VRSAVSVRFFSQPSSLACGLLICVQWPALDSFSLHGPRARSDFLASTSVRHGDLSIWLLSSSCVKLSPSTGFGSRFHEALQKIRFLCIDFCVDYCRNSSGYVLEQPNKKLEVLWFELLFRGGFPNVYSRCSMKYL
jgi:hypothetical protein